MEMRKYDRESIIRDLQERANGASDGAWMTVSCAMARSIVDLLKEGAPVSPKHISKEHSEHKWVKYENGNIDMFAFDMDFHNGPVCERCGYSYCVNCDPEGDKKQPCIVDEYRCPSCNNLLTKNKKFCDNCGQAVKWE